MVAVWQVAVLFLFLEQTSRIVTKNWNKTATCHTVTTFALLLSLCVLTQNFLISLQAAWLHLLHLAAIREMLRFNWFCTNCWAQHTSLNPFPISENPNTWRWQNLNPDLDSRQRQGSRQPAQKKFPDFPWPFPWLFSLAFPWLSLTSWYVFYFKMPSASRRKKDWQTSGLRKKCI